MKYIKIKSFKCTCLGKQNHVHEIQGSLLVDLSKDTKHNHRFLTITNGVLSISNKDHVHEVSFRTEYSGGHYHEYIGRTSGAIPVGDGHIHYMESITSINEGHSHKFKTSTGLDNPKDV